MLQFYEEFNERKLPFQKKKYLRSAADVLRISKAERLEDLDPISSFSLETALEATILHFEFKDNGP